MRRIIGNPTRYVQAILESWLDEKGAGFSLKEEEAFDLVRREYPELLEAELKRILGSEEILNGSRLQKVGPNGKRLRLNPKIKREHEDDLPENDPDPRRWRFRPINEWLY